MVAQRGAPKKRRHKNDERTVKCPVESCDAEPLARGAYLHVLRSDGDGHGPQGDVPPGLDFDNLETVGEREVAMNYPEHREVEDVARLCPYCERPFRGKHGVMIHLAQVEGRKDHPPDAHLDHDPDDFTIVHVDEAGNIIEAVDSDEEAVLPSVEKQRTNENLRKLARLISEGRRDEAQDLADEVLAA